MLADVYLTMHPQNIGVLVRERDREYRLYSGFSGWTRPSSSTRQLILTGRRG